MGTVNEMMAAPFLEVKLAMLGMLIWSDIIGLVWMCWRGEIGDCHQGIYHCKATHRWCRRQLGLLRECCSWKLGISFCTSLS